MKNKIIINLSVLVALFLCNFAFAGAPIGGSPFYDVRVYCEYRDNKQGKNITFKLLSKDKAVKSMFKREIGNARYIVSEPKFSELVNSCKNEIGDRGDFIRLRGTNAGNYESLTLYYDVKDE
jgi:hypothetical protein